MERIIGRVERSNAGNKLEKQALEIISESRNREEAAEELKRMLLKKYPNYEMMSRAERVAALNELKEGIDITDGASPYSQNNENRFFAEVLSLSLEFETRALDSGFENPNILTLH
jgi:hypothetical protein